MNTLVASGGSDGQQGILVLVFIVLFAVALTVMNLVNRFRQPFVVVLQNPFKLLVKTVMLGVTTTVVTVAVISIIIATAGSPS
ncbi:hypothetical protein [Kineosporia babensis]|uniref:Uncharacterized protein n=1 Tax=Kineosporia babensis TaxID=499548 RepID=A0A9X1NFX4_9ACTN|nr:hypothetical protein [Kineosporia babensis]MCD5313081.1 hypothetical protein [Kineosporia babensis]